MFTIRALGHGGAFATLNDGQSNFVLTAPTGALMLLDCGSDIRHLLRDANIDPCELDAVYVSHLHSDHVGGLEYLAFWSKFVTGKKLKLYIKRQLVKQLWSSVKESLRFLHGGLANLEFYFDVVPVDDIEEWNGLRLQIYSTLHIDSEDEIMMSYGLYIGTAGGNRVLWTSDTCVPYKPRADFETVTAIFHDCETHDRASNVHARFESLCALPVEVKRKMYLYHYASFPAWSENGFAAAVRKGKTYHF